VTRCGCICLGRRKINLSRASTGQIVGIREVDDQIWLVSFLDFDLGLFDDETCRLGSVQNPFGAKVLPMCPV
jgi:putative transposase